MEAMRNSQRAAGFLRTWRKDYICQMMVSASESFGCTARFALYNGYLGLCCESAWHGSIGILCFLLAAIRGMALLTERRNRARPEAEQNRCRRTFLISSILLLSLDLALIWPMSVMAALDKSVSMGMILAITIRMLYRDLRQTGSKNRSSHIVLLGSEHSMGGS